VDGLRIVSVNDTSPRDQAALLLNAKKAAGRTPRLGEEVWRLRDTTGGVQSCELRDLPRPAPAGTSCCSKTENRCSRAAARWSSQDLVETLSERFVSRFELLRADAAEMTVAAR